MERKIREVKIKEVEIIGLYNMYDYKIKFNEDITFLHGKNGCGKTTILNIITYIITGRVYKLFSYDFKSITLVYKEEKRNSKIIFTREKKDIKINYKNKEVKILELEDESENDTDIVSSRLGIRRSNSALDFKYFDKYPILREIKILFDFVYIPLNRNNLVERDRFTLFRYRRFQRIGDNIDEPIYNAARMILEKYARIKGEISGLGKTLQTDIVKAMYQYNIDDYVINKVELKKGAKKDIDNFRKANLCDEELENQIKIFYKKLLEDINSEVNPRMEYIFNASKIAQVNKISEVFDNYDKKVKSLNEPIDKLEKIVNRFFEDSAEPKKLCIEEDEVYFLTKHNERKVKIGDLSSGEKQILILFTYLIFDIANKHNPIFIIDEPELSLHLLWQKNFVNSVLETNHNMQLILATHAPEIIGEYKDKAYKVELKLN